MRFRLVGLLAFCVYFDKIGAIATQGPNRAVVGVCQSYSVQKAISPGGALEARASVGCGSCASGQKCCEPKNAAPFCIPEDSSCCGRTWCSAGFQCCEYGDNNGGCCPIGGKCAVGGRGCCKDGEQCFGPFRCHNFGSIACTMGEVDSFLCCSAAYPYCRWDPSFGYGCLDSEDTQSVIEGTQSVIRSRSESPNASFITSTIESRSRTTATATSTSSSGNEVVTSVPNTSERTRKEPHTLSATSLTTALPGTFSTTTDTNMTTGSETKRFSGTRGSTTTTAKPGTTVAATGTASPSDTSTAIGAGFADLSRGLGWGAIFVWLARLLIV
ncbi:hypothetical protein HOY80DRAFT_987796 [Tuber brumale]|nr:hypothetical protein HOY80DRAFT_987796 [Tuber brumale]